MATTRVIATATTTVQQNCAWVQALQFQNTDGLVPPTLTPFDLTGITLTGHFRNTAVPGTPIAAATFTVATPASGIAVAGLSAHDAGLLPAGTGIAFNQLKHIVLEIDGVHASDPNNPFRLAEIDVGVSPGGNSTPTTATAPTTPLGSIALTVGSLVYVPPATSSTPGTMSAADKTALDARLPSAGEKTAITALAANGEDYLASGTVPAFVANAASIAPGTDKASYYSIESTRTLAAGSALTVATTGTPPVGNLHISCKALALGFAMTIVNGGPAGGNLGSGFASSLTRARIMHLWFDGTNYIFNGYDFII